MYTIPLKASIFYDVTDKECSKYNLVGKRVILKCCFCMRMFK